MAGFVQGANSVNDRPGAFAEYVVSSANLVWTVPESMKTEEAAAVSLCALTAAQALFYRLGLPSPFKWDTSEQRSRAVSRPLTFFIYGATTSVGMYVAQLLRFGCEANGVPPRLIGTASKKHFETLKNTPYGYDVLVDYRDQNWPEQIRKAAGAGGVKYGIDCISEGETVK